MSTNKTQNYNLHAWEAVDNFLLSEINENFALLDASASHVVCGSYTGDGESSQTIHLGFAPKGVFLIHQNGYIKADYTTYGGLALPGRPIVLSAGGKPLTALELTEEGFTVFYATWGNYSVNTNRLDSQLRYLAIR